MKVRDANWKEIQGCRSNVVKHGVVKFLIREQPLKENFK